MPSRVLLFAEAVRGGPFSGAPSVRVQIDSVTFTGALPDVTFSDGAEGLVVNSCGRRPDPRSSTIPDAGAADAT